jgi:hypothetical protein
MAIAIRNATRGMAANTRPKVTGLCPGEVDGRADHNPTGQHGGGATTGSEPERGGTCRAGVRGRPSRRSGHADQAARQASRPRSGPRDDRAAIITIHCLAALRMPLTDQNSALGRSLRSPAALECLATC